jgi:hypothetical protein
MLTHPQIGSGVRRSFWRFDVRAVLIGIGKFMFIALLFLLFLWLAHSMAEHRFFEGGWYNRNGTIRP